MCHYNLTVAWTQRCARQSSFVTLASIGTIFFIATTFQQFLARHSNHPKCCPVWCPIIFLCSNFPPPVFCMSCTQFKDWPQTWSPWYAALFVCSSNAALVGGMASYWCYFRGKHFKTCFVHIALSDMMTTKCFNTLNVLVTDGSRCFTHTNKHICRFIKGFPCLPCCSLTFSTKDWYCVPWAKCIWYLMKRYRYPSEMFAFTKSYPQFIYLKLLEHRNS